MKLKIFMDQDEDEIIFDMMSLNKRNSGILHYTINLFTINTLSHEIHINNDLGGFERISLDDRYKVSKVFKLLKNRINYLQYIENTKKAVMKLL